MNKKTLIILIIIIISCGLITYVLMAKKTEQPIKQIGTGNTQGELIDPFDLSKKTLGTKTYYSENNGIGFTYLPNPDLDITIGEKDNKIYIHPTNFSPEQGQHIEIFNKKTDQTLTDAIKEKFLAGYDENKCFVKQLTDRTLPQNYTSAIISFPPSSSPEEPWWEKSKDCPQNYSETNGIRFFLYNENIPTKFIFVELGQAALTTDGTPRDENGQGKDWSHSLRIVK